MADRPTQPYLDGEGRPRLRAANSPNGPVEYRPGEAIVNLDAFDGARKDLTIAIREIERVAKHKLTYEDGDVGMAQESGFLRVRLDPRSDILEIATSVDEIHGQGAFSPNIVFRVGAITADPMRFAGGFGADPMRFASAYGADPMRFANSSTARPAATPNAQHANVGQCKGMAHAIVAILDTGVPIQGAPAAEDVDFVGIGGGVRDTPDLNQDDYLDIAAGHSTFIRTIVQRAAPGASIMCEGVVHNDGDGDEACVAASLRNVFHKVKDKNRLLVNLSFSAYYPGDTEPPLVAFWIRMLVDAGAVVVAAAGNDGACRPKFPAAMPEVISVGSIGPCGPSPFSNHGPWVDACAPGEDLISGFFNNFNGAYKALLPGLVPDIDDFSGWAMWSGTSFSTPATVGALAEIIETHDCPAQAAVDILIRQPGLFRLPDYGVVVNRVF